ncbi:MAG: flagellar biosynthesis regulator FlaF [Pseudomonadota bacterium]
MTAPGASHAAYGQASKVLGTPRSIEYQVFAQVNGRLAAASGPEGSFPQLADALWENQRLWTALISDLAQPDNALPEALRGQLISLGAFVMNHTRRVIARDAEAGPLVDINAAVMRGLRARADAAETAA